MNDRKQEIEAIFHAAAELDSPEQREIYLNRACGGDASLRSEVETLLRAVQRADQFFDDAALAGSPSSSSTILVNDDAPAGSVNLTECPGTIIGRYKLLQRIGEGGCGVVYMAEQEEPVRRRVALKVIKLGMDTKSVIARFEAERQALAMMDHPNIARVLDGGATEAGRPYFVMELVQGVPITEFCDKNKLPARERLQLFIQVCHAIQSAHQKGVIHRDIKPSNVLVTLHHGEPMPKVIDFGIAKATNQKLTEKTLFTNYATMIGTPAYMSPEQAEMSSLDVDTRTDVYALGVLLYELLTGTTPFPEKRLRSLGYGEMQRVIIDEEPERPSTRLSTMANEQKTAVAKNRGEELASLSKLLKGDLDWVVMKCLEKDRRRRYDTPNELVADLHRHLGQEPVVARPPSASYRFQKLVRRNKLPFAAAAAVALALLVGLSLAAIGWRQARIESNSAVNARKEAQANERKAREAEVKEARLRQDAQAQELVARRNEYASNMRLLQQALAVNNVGQARELLDRHVPKPGERDLRGWEWRFLWQQCRGDASFKLPHGTNLVRAIATSHDGNWLAINEWSPSRAKQALSVLDISALQTPREVAQFPTGSGSVRTAFSPREALLAYSSVINSSRTNAQSSVHLWNAETKESHPDLILDGKCKGLAFSIDGRKLLTYSTGEKGITGEDRHLALWHVPEGKLFASYHAPQSASGGQSFAAANDLSVVALIDSTLRIVDLSTGDERWSVKTDNLYFSCAAFSPDRKILVTADGRVDSSIRIWDVATGKEIGPGLKDHRVLVSGLVFWPDGKTLASSGFDQTIRLWDVSDPMHVQPRGKPLRGHTSSVTALALLPDNKTLVSSSWDGSVHAWDITTIRDGKSYVTLPGVGNWGFASDGKSILTINKEGQVAQRQGREFETNRPLLGIGTTYQYASFSEDGRLLAVGLTNGIVQLWDLQKRALLRQFDHYQAPVSLEFLPEGKKMVVYEELAGETSVAHEWDLATWQEAQSWRFPLGPTCVSPDGRWHLAHGMEGDFLLKELPTGREQHLSLDIRDPRGTSFSPNGKLFAVASQLGFIRLWEMATLQPVATFGSFLIGAHSVAFSPDGTRLIAGGDGSEAIKLWDVDSGQELLTLEGQQSAFWRLAFSPDGNVLVSLQQDHVLHLWRAPSWEEIAAAEAKGKMLGMTP